MYYGGAMPPPRPRLPPPGTRRATGRLEVLYSAAFPGDGRDGRRLPAGGRPLPGAGAAGPPGGRRLCQPPGEALSVFGVAVDPALQGQGLGGGLMAALLDELAPLRGKRHVLLEVDGVNERALRLYASSGFTVRRQVEYYSLPLPQAAPSGV